MLLCHDCMKIYFKYYVNKTVEQRISFRREENILTEDVIDSSEQTVLTVLWSGPGSDFSYCCVADTSHEISFYNPIYSDLYDTFETIEPKRDKFVHEILPYLQSLISNNEIDLEMLSVEDSFKVYDIIENYYTKVVI